MPGLSFLSKKKWHTSNIKNVEKVWIAEQKSEQEAKRVAELQKQLLEERQIQELRQLQAAQGQVFKQTDNSLDWMYEGPSGESKVQKDSEEYLLGKIYKPQPTQTFDVGSAPSAVASKSSSNWVSKVSNKNDIFSRRHEDPMIMIKQAEKEQRDKIINNPIKMDRIRQNIAKELEELEFERAQRKRAKKELKNREKEEKKLKKQLKKDKKKDKREKSDKPSSRYDGDSDSDSDNDDKREESRGRKRARSQSRSPSRSRSGSSESKRSSASSSVASSVDKHKENTRRRQSAEENSADGNHQDRDHGRPTDRDRDDRSRRSRSRDQRAEKRSERKDSRERNRYRDSRSPKRRNVNDYEDRRRTSEYKQDRRSTERDRSRDRSYDRRPRDRREDSRDRYRSRNNRDERDRNSDDRRDRGREDRDSTRPSNSYDNSSNVSSRRGKLEGYGLLSSSSAQTTEKKDFLGPRPELLRQKEEALRKQEEERQALLRQRRGGNGGLSEEDRLKRIAAMQADALKVDSTRVAVHGSNGEKRELELGENSGRADFIRSMRSEVLDSAAEHGIQQRLDQHRQYSQRAADLDDSNQTSFLARR